MSIDKALGLGLAANEVSKTITGSNETTLGRSVVATGVGTAFGAAASGGLVVASEAVGLASLAAAAAPVVVPLAVASGVVALVASLFGDE